ncbi:MAG: metallophosphoesterase family protein [bacterium]|nr:metallophosphoesterase family protein [bacterium]
MPGCDFTRRHFLRWTAVAAASPLFTRRLFDNGVAAARSRRGPISAVNLELVTLTEQRAIITWYTGYTGTDDGLGRMEPAPADGVVYWGTDPQRLTRIAVDRWRDTPYHYVELRGLEPGETYYYQARSNDLPATPTPFTLIAGNAVGTSGYGLTTGGPYAFTAPQPPPGRFLFSVALCNDLHVGETTAGLVGGTPITGIQQEPGLPPYPEVMLRALVHDATRLGASFLLAAGDITAEAAPVDLSRAGKLLRRFGRYRRHWFVTRGNHDRAHDGEEYAACRIGRWQGHDCFQDRFFPAGEPGYFARELQGLRILGLDTYDKPGRGNDAGALSGEQLAWFRDELGRARDQPTIVFGHHPLIVEQSPFPTSASNTLEPAQVATLLSDYAGTPGLFLHHAGHTHRNKRTISAAAPNVTMQEVAACKEYPGGFSLLRLYTGGFAMNFHKTRSRLARRWSERSRQEILGLWPQFSLGASVSDRNTVVARDLSGLTPVPGAKMR